MIDIQFALGGVSSSMRDLFISEKPWLQCFLDITTHKHIKSNKRMLHSSKIKRWLKLTEAIEGQVASERFVLSAILHDSPQPSV